MDKRISAAKRRQIYNARQQYESTIEQLYLDTVFELSIKLELNEELVRKEFDESI